MGRGRWLGMALLLVASPALAGGKGKKVRKQIDAGQYAAASETGRAWLEKHPDDVEVTLLVAQADYLLATELNTLEAYQDFRSRWRVSPYDDRVDEQMAHLVFADIEAEPTIEAWQSFRRRFPDSGLVAESLALEEDLAWEQARQVDTVPAYKAFAEAYPSSRYLPAAQRLEAELVWADVVEQDNLDGYLFFLRKYPHSGRAEEATERSEALAWDRAREADDIETWREYREAFADGERGALAYEREVELSWTGSLNAHSIPVYRSFELDYPETAQALDAEDREWDLYHFERDLYPGELRPSITRARRQEDGSYELWFDVIDPQGNLVGGLQEEHFTVYDAGYEGQVVEVLGMEHNRPLDVVFVVDVSGSMSDEIDGVKAGIQRFADIMTLRSRDVRLGLVTFIEEVFAVNGSRGGGPLTANANAFQGWVDRIDTDSPGSEEDHLMALDRAANLPFRKDAQKVLVLLSDEDATLRRRFRDPTAFGNALEAEDFAVYSVTPRTRTFETLVDRTSGSLFELPTRAGSFSTIMDALAQKLSKQYRLRYRRPAEAPPVTGDLEVQLRIRADHAWLASGDASAGPGFALVRWHPTDRGVVYFGGLGGGLLCSADEGRSLTPCGEGLPLTDPLVELLFADGAVYAQTRAGALWVSQDRGLRFDPIDLDAGPALALVLDPSDQGRVIASEGRLLWRHGDGGWSPVSLWGPDAGVRTVSAHPTDPVVLLLDEEGGLWRSEDAGRSFESVPYPGPTPAGFAFHPTRQGLCFAWGDDGLWRSLDNGRSWRRLDLDTSGSPIRALLFDPTVRRLTLAVTQDGVWASDDLGRSWYAQSTGLDGELASGSVSPTGRVLLAGEGSGLWGMERVANREFVFSSVYFASGAARPNAALLPHLDEMAEYLKKNRRVVLRVEGHTDSDGGEEANQALSEERARWVCDYMEQQGVAPHQLRAAGYGELRPLFPNDTPMNKARNRRVELVLVAPQQDLPPGEGMR